MRGYQQKEREFSLPDCQSKCHTGSKLRYYRDFLKSRCHLRYLTPGSRGVALAMYYKKEGG